MIASSLMVGPSYGWTLALAAAGVVVGAAIGNARAARPSSVSPEPAETLYPYLVPDAYLPHTDAAIAPIPLGHGVHVALVFELRGLVRSATGDDLRRLGMGAAQAHERALQNLEGLLVRQEIHLARFDGPGGKPFILVGGHWAAATAILVPGLRTLAASSIGTDELCASIPHREALLIFPCADRAHRDAMRAVIHEKESDGRKPLTWNLFRLGEGGPTPQVEDEPGRPSSAN